MKTFSALLIGMCMICSCSNEAAREAEIQKAKQATIDSLNAIAAKQHVIDSMNAALAAQQARSSHASTAGYDAVEGENTAPAPAKKKGWSSTAKGAVIGAGTGAIAGALIDKKHGEGAIVGGLLGAAAGAGTGAIIDGKKKKKPNQ